MLRSMLTSFLWLVAISSSPAQEPYSSPVHKFGDVSIQQKWTPQLDQADVVRHGYLEFRFAVRNHSSDKTRTIALTMPGRLGETPSLSLTRTVEIAPSTSVEMSLWQPPVNFTRHGFARNISVEVKVDGQTQKQGMSVSAKTRQPLEFHRHRGSLIQILVPSGERRTLQNMMNMAPAVGGHRLPRQQPEVQVSEYAEPLAVWSTNWLGYSSLDGLMVEGKELEGAPAGVRQAIWRYVESGGTLICRGPCKLPSHWVSDTDSKLQYKGAYGGFGRCITIGEKSSRFRFEATDELTSMKESVRGTARPWFEQHDLSTYYLHHPVVEKVGLPLRSMFLVMFVFTILVGPVNFYVLTRMNRRLWMLWTVPAFSLLACLAIFAYTTLYEGWEIKSRSEAFTILDERSQRATTLGWLGIYSPLTPGQGIHFDRLTEVTPIERVETNRRGQPESVRMRSIDWSEDQNLAFGWVRARVPTYFRLRRSERRLERLLVRKGSDKSLTAVNGLKAPIKQLWVADLKGNVFTAENVDAGAEVKLAHARDIEPVQQQADLLRTVYRRWFRRTSTKSSQFVEQLQPGCYIAIVEGTPFLQPGMDGATQIPSQSVVYGFMKEPVDAS